MKYSEGNESLDSMDDYEREYQREKRREDRERDKKKHTKYFERQFNRKRRYIDDFDMDSNDQESV